MSKTLNELRKKIRNEVGYIGVRPYSHNIVGLLLSQIAQEYGTAEANKTIRDFHLDTRGWIERKDDDETAK